MADTSRIVAIPDLDPRLLIWDADASVPDDLCLTEVRPLPGDAASVSGAELDGHLHPLSAGRTGPAPDRARPASATIASSATLSFGPPRTPAALVVGAVRARIEDVVHGRR